MIPSELVNCNLCGSKDFKVVYEASQGHAGDPTSYYQCTSQDLAFHDRIVKCKRCSLMYSNPRESSQEILAHYNRVVDETYLGEKDGRYLTFARSLDHLERSKRRGRILDVGCYTGLFLEVAQSRGWEVWGTEPSAWAAKYAKETSHLNVFHGTLREARYPSEHFDVITLWDVIEHFTDPKLELQEVHRVLKKDGLLVITTMLMDSLLPVLMRGKYPFILKMHLYYFTRKTLTRCLEEAGFKFVRHHDHVRVITMNYLANRIQPYSRSLHKIFRLVIEKLLWKRRPIPIPFSGVKTIYAQKCPPK